MIFPNSYHTKTSLVKSKIIWVSFTMFQCASWRWPWEMHLNCLKKIVQASKLVKRHLNNSDQNTFPYDAMPSGCRAVALTITLRLISYIQKACNNILANRPVLRGTRTHFDRCPAVHPHQRNVPHFQKSFKIFPHLCAFPVSRWLQSFH